MVTGVNMFYNNKNAVSNNILVNSCVGYSIVTVLHELVDKSTSVYG